MSDTRRRIRRSCHKPIRVDGAGGCALLNLPVSAPETTVIEAPAVDAHAIPVVEVRTDATLLRCNKQPTLGEIEQLEARLLQCEQAGCPLDHQFAPGVYLRKVTMPKGALVIGHRHKTEHFNIILRGRASVYMDGKVHEIVAPCIIKSGVNVRKALYIHEEMEWATLHPTATTELPALEEELIIKSDSFLDHQRALADAEQLRLHVAQSSNSQGADLH